MLKTIQEIFNRLQDKRKQMSIMRQKHKEELGTNAEYIRVKDDMEKLRAKKKQYELMVKQQTGSRADELALAVRADAQMLSDIALTSIMKGESVGVKDDRGEYEPVFTVRFKKTK